MSKYFDWLKGEPADMMGDYRKAYKVKTRFGMLGPVASGKSTICAAIVHTCEVRSSLVPNFYCRVLPTSTHILHDANNLLQGKFPEKTDPMQPKAPEAGFLIYERGWRKKKVQVPICDVAGEITDYIAYKTTGLTPAQMIQQRMGNINTKVVQEVKDCQGFIIAMSAPDALMFRKEGAPDNDVYTHNVLNEIMEYRRRMKRPDPEIIAIITKWDMVRDPAREIGMDIFDDSELGLAKFWANGYPATNMLLKPLRDKGRVHYFRSWFSIKERNDGTKVYWDTGKTKPVIDLLEDEAAFIRFRPKFAEEDYASLVNLLGSFGK